jgi:hypothetical protein
MSCPNCANFKGYCDCGPDEVSSVSLGATNKPAKRGVTTTKVVHYELTSFFDVDQTLVMWKRPSQGETYSLEVTCPYDGNPIYLDPHHPHIKLLKNHSARGYYVTVWSANGYQWAKCIVDALELGPFVNQIMSKPRAFVDDLPAAEVLGEHIYLQPDSIWGNNGPIA